LTESSVPAKTHLVEVGHYSLLYLLLFQLVSAFVEGIYVSGFLGTSIPAEVVSVVLFLSPLVLVLLPTDLSGRPLGLVGEAMLACRIAEPLLLARWRLHVAGLGVARSLIRCPSLLRGRQDSEE